MTFHQSVHFLILYFNIKIMLIIFNVQIKHFLYKFITQRKQFWNLDSSHLYIVFNF